MRQLRLLGGHSSRPTKRREYRLNNLAAAEYQTVRQYLRNQLQAAQPCWRRSTPWRRRGLASSVRADGLATLVGQRVSVGGIGRLKASMIAIKRFVVRLLR